MKGQLLNILNDAKYDISKAVLMASDKVAAEITKVVRKQSGGKLKWRRIK
jgi:hypothetical protein